MVTVMAAFGNGDILEMIGQRAQGFAHHSALHGRAVPGDHKLRFQIRQETHRAFGLLPVLGVIHGRSVHIGSLG